MKMTLAVAALAATLTAGCGREHELKRLDHYESVDLAASGNNFYVPAGAHFLPDLTNALRRAHLVIHPDAKAAPPTACYETDATVDAVASFYAEKYGYGLLGANRSAATPGGFFFDGDLQTDARAIAPLIPKLGLHTDLTKAQGHYTAAQVNAKPGFPRVSIQRPYFDPTKSAVIDKTSVILVKE